MKKSFLTVSIALSLSAMGVAAQENTGGDAAEMFSVGGIKGEKIVAGVVVAGVAIAMINNSSGSSTPTPTPTPTPSPSCDGEDALVDGFCVGTTNTVTVSGTGTVSVPVTFTYAPSA
jgi:hypothetical protein